MPLTFAQQTAVKRLLMDELTALKAGNLVLFKIITKVDTCETLELLVSVVCKAVTLLVDEKAAVGLDEKIRVAARSVD